MIMADPIPRISPRDILIGSLLPPLPWRGPGCSPACSCSSAGAELSGREGGLAERERKPGCSRLSSGWDSHSVSIRLLAARRKRTPSAREDSSRIEVLFTWEPRWGKSREQEQGPIREQWLARSGG